MPRLDKQQIIQRFREIGQMPQAPHQDVGFIFWDQSTGALEMGASHENPEDLIKQLGMWRDSEISGETVLRFERELKQRAAALGLEEQLDQIMGGDAGGPRIILPDEVPTPDKTS